MFNGSNTIDEISIQTLGFIANLTKHIRLKSSATAAATGAGGDVAEDSLEDLNRFLPSFVWILRNFTLELRDEVC